MGLESYSEISLTNLVTLPQLTSALTLLYPSHKMSSPQKAADSPSKRPREDETEEDGPVYDPFVWREYDETATQAVKSVHGVPDDIPKITCEGDSDGTTLAMTVEGCPPGKYNQSIRIWDDRFTTYVPSTDGKFANHDKIASKGTGDSGRAMAAQLKIKLAEAIASAPNFQRFVAKAERAALKNMSAEERVQWVVGKIDEGDYAIPVAQREDVNDETGAVTYEITAIKARSGFARTKKGATGEAFAAEVRKNITNDPGVVAASEAIEGKEFSPPPVTDAIGNPIPWYRLTNDGTLGRFSFAGIVEIQLLGVNKIAQKSTGTRSFATIPTKISSIRVCRMRDSEESGPKIDPRDKRVRMF